MKNFTYRSLEEKENIEEILRQRKRRLNRQQVISGTILVVLIAIVALYYGNRVYYTVFDGYVHLDVNRVRTPFDIYLDSVYVETGDLVFPGDTLYSYYSMDYLRQRSSLSDEPGIVARNRDYQLRYNNARQNLSILSNTITQLRAQLSEIDININFGLADRQQKLSLERQLADAQARMRAQRAEVETLARAIDDTRPRGDLLATKDTTAQRTMIYDDFRSTYLRNSVSYAVASDSSIIVNVLAPEHMIFFEKEEIITMQHLNLQANNLQVVGFIPVDKMDRVTNNTKAEIIANDDVSFRAHMSMLGVRTQVIPENLRSYFSKQNVAVIAIFDVNEGQRIPFWSVASGLPVTIRVKNFDIWGHEEDPNDYLWFTTGEGLTNESLKFHFQKTHSKYVDTPDEEVNAIFPWSRNRQSNDSTKTNAPADTAATKATAPAARAEKKETR